MNNYDKNFNEEVYPNIIEKLGEKKRYFTKTNMEPNFVRIVDDEVYVRTQKSFPDYKKVPKDMFLKTWIILLTKRRITQQKLSKEYNIKRSAFIIIAFDLLDYVKYDYPVDFECFSPVGTISEIEKAITNKNIKQKLLTNQRKVWSLVAFVLTIIMACTSDLGNGGAALVGPNFGINIVLFACSGTCKLAPKFWVGPAKNITSLGAPGQLDNKNRARTSGKHHVQHIRSTAPTGN